MSLAAQRSEALSHYFKKVGVEACPCPEEHWAEWKRCKDDVVYWIEKYVQTYDPRMKEGERWIKFVLWPRQVEFMAWLKERYAKKQHCVVLKCRDVGASWLVLCFFTHIWLFERDAKLALGSRKEDLVDSAGDMDALFPKVREILKKLPEWAKPENFNPREHDLGMKLINPTGGTVMTGEAGKNIGTGGRSTAMLIDEFAKVEFSEQVQGSVQDNSDFIVYVSTPEGPNNEFGRMVTTGSHPVFRFTYKDDPRRNRWVVVKGDWDIVSAKEGDGKVWTLGTGSKIVLEGNGHTSEPGAIWPWYEEQRVARSPVNLARQVDADVYGSQQKAVFPGEYIEAAVRINLESNGPVVAGLDLGDSDVSPNTVLTVRQGGRCLGQASTVGRAVSKKMSDLLMQCEEARTPDGGKIEQVVYDASGEVGSAFGSEIDAPRFSFTLIPLIGQAPASKRVWKDGNRSDQLYANARTEAYFMLRERMRKSYERLNGLKDHPDEECLSISGSDSELLNELRMIECEDTETGKVKVVSKAKMKAAGNKSPNKADSLVYAFSHEKLETTVSHRYGQRHG